MNTLGVFTSDSVNRLGQKFTVGALESMLQQTYKNGLPQLIEHDSHRAVGWTYPTSLLLEPHLRRVIGFSSIPEHDSEWRKIQEKYLNYSSERVISQGGDSYSELAKILGKSATEKASIHYASCPVLIEEGLAAKVFPEIFKAVDKDNLVDFGSLDYVGNGCFRKGDLVFFVHPYLRRSLSRLNNVNGDFMASFVEASSNSGVTKVRIALDPDMVGLASKVLEPLEHAYWRGPFFSDTLEEIPIGVNVHGADESQRLWFQISKTEFWWSSRDSIHTLEIEELIDGPMPPNSDKYGCRYVHSQVDETNGTINHLDGAIRAYTEQAYIDQRLDQDIMHAGKKTDYTKLWRLDGVLPLSQWKALIANFFRQNPLVGEYLGSRKEDIPPPDEAASDSRTPSPLLRFVPHSIADGPQLRLILSYKVRESVDENGPTRTAVTARTWETESGESFNLFEFISLDLEKHFATNRCAISGFEGALFAAYDDLYMNLPLIRHLGDQSFEDMIKSLELIGSFISLWEKDKAERTYCFALSWLESDKEVILSVLGTGGSIQQLIAEQIIGKRSSEDPEKWCENLADFLDRSFPNKSELGNVTNGIINPDGFFEIFRRYVEVAAINSEFAEVKVLSDEKDAVELLENKQLSLVRGMVMKEQSCSSCGQEYRQCPHRRFVDQGIYVKPGQHFGVARFWSDRPAGPKQG